MKKCKKCGKPSGKRNFCKRCLESFPGEGSRVYNCINPECGKEYCTNSRRPGYCPICISRAMAVFHNCINRDCGKEYRSNSSTNGYCPDCRNSAGVGDIIRKCINCGVMTHTWSRIYQLCPKCLEELPGKGGGKILMCDKHWLYKSNGTNSYCPICFEEAKGEGDSLYTCINPKCGKKYRTNSHNKPSYCPECKDSFPGEGDNVIVCSEHGPYKATGPNTLCPKCVRDREKEAAAEKDARIKKEQETYPVAIKFLIDNFGANIFDFDSINYIAYSPAFARILDNICGVIIERIDDKPVNLINTDSKSAIAADCVFFCGVITSIRVFTIYKNKDFGG